MQIEEGSAPKKRRSFFIFLLKLLVSGVLLGWLFYRYNIVQELRKHTQGMELNYWWLFFGIAANFFTNWLSGLRWHLVLCGQHLIYPYKLIQQANWISYFFNLTSLGSIGADTYRVIHLHQYNKKITEVTKFDPQEPKNIRLMTSLIIDHLAGFAAVSAMFLLSRFYYFWQGIELDEEIRWMIQGFQHFMAGSVLFLGGSFILFTPKLYQWGEPRMKWILGNYYIKQFALACDMTRQSWATSLGAIGISLVMFPIHFFTFYAAIRFLSHDADITTLFMTMPIIDTITAAPITLSGLGVREKFFASLMVHLQNTPAAIAVSASLIGWMMTIPAGVFGGMVFLRHRQVE
jgi:uncharacterized membrane protein YbhN (UPF0104 family)